MIEYRFHWWRPAPTGTPAPVFTAEAPSKLHGAALALQQSSTSSTRTMCFAPFASVTSRARGALTSYPSLTKCLVEGP
jgi:hypothetical protein